MRTREEIKKQFDEPWNQYKQGGVILEVLLDIRDMMKDMRYPVVEIPANKICKCSLKNLSHMPYCPEYKKEECHCWNTEDGRPEPTADELDENGMCKHGVKVGKQAWIGITSQSLDKKHKCPECGKETEITERQAIACHAEKGRCFECANKGGSQAS